MNAREISTETELDRARRELEIVQEGYGKLAEGYLNLIKELVGDNWEDVFWKVIHNLEGFEKEGTTHTGGDNYEGMVGLMLGTPSIEPMPAPIPPETVEALKRVAAKRALERNI